jgi:hypothetical protein
MQEMSPSTGTITSGTAQFRGRVLLNTDDGQLARSAVVLVASVRFSQSSQNTNLYTLLGSLSVPVSPQRLSSHGESHISEGPW